ncbi:putative Longin-like domain-containing protein [Lupinus albus]|uniref:Putative Longin-like domain-containing protein n=1 Tax=Lupinus albus TaxID=3870 RepID=A0A6A4NE15_LUPAL|nr:putative Longin-like domain-containing protein [Lupinus albus]
MFHKFPSLSPYLLSKSFFFSSLHFLKLVSIRDVFYLLLFTYLQCELDIMFHLEKAHSMLEEMVMNGCILDKTS